MNEEVKKEEKKTVRDTLYGKIDVSVQTMDKVLIILFVLLAFSLVVGILI
ncbi:hypothetical protein [Clostridium sp.]